MDKSNRVLALLVSVALVFTFGTLAGCAKQTETTGAGETKKETIKVGVHTSLTGGLADYGFAASEALKIAAEDMSPFTAGDTEYTIELVIKDDKGEQNESNVVAQSLVDEQVVGVIGCLTSGNTNASLPIYQQASLPVISGSATNPDITDKGGFENFYRTCLRDDLQGQAIGEWAVELGAKKAVVMDDKGDYAVGLGDFVEKTLKEKGVEVQREHGQEGDVDFSAQVSNIKGFDPDVVIYTGYHREAGLLRKQMAEAGLTDVKFMGGDGIKSDEIVKEAGGEKNVDGALCTFGSLSQEQMPGYADFAAKFKEVTGKDAGPYAENNYDALGALVEGIKKAGGTDGAGVIAALGEVKVAGVMGEFSFDDKGDIAIPGKEGTKAIPRFEMKGGKWTYMGQ